MNKGKFFLWWRLVALLIVVIGAIAGLLFDKELEGAITILAGAVIYIIPFFIGKSVYECPECKAQFDIPKCELILKTSRRAGAALLTCPKCKKTNFCFKKLVFKFDDEKN